MCDIQSIQLSGQGFSAQGIPSALGVLARVDCPAVNIEIRRSTNDPTPMLSQTNVASVEETEPVPGMPPRHVIHVFTLPPGVSVKCDETLVVTIVCADDAGCRVTERAVVHCKGFEPTDCPSTVVLSTDPPVHQTGDCLPAGTYVITVEDPLGADVDYFWSANEVGGPPPTDLPGSGPTQTFQVQDGDPPTIVSVIAMKSGCPPRTGNILFPAGDDANCPTGFSVSVLRGGASVAGPHTNLQGVDWDVPAVAPGAYTVAVTQPPGEFEWFDNTGVLVASGAQNSRDVTVVAGQSTTLSFRVKPSDCCPAMSGRVTLTGASGGTDDTDDTDDPDDTDDTDDSNDPDDPNTPVVVPPPPLCLILDIIVALALVVALVSVVAGACAMLLPAAIPILIGAVAVAVVAAVLALIICRPSLCRVLSVIVWALKWAIMLGAVVALACGGLLGAFVVVIYGGIIAALIWLMIGRGCAVPRMLGLP